jgi:hypothetical protein
LRLEEFRQGLCLNNQSLGLIGLSYLLFDNLGEGRLDLCAAGRISSLDSCIDLGGSFYIILHITFLGLSGFRVCLHWGILVGLSGSGGRGLSCLLGTVLLLGSIHLLDFGILFGVLDVLGQLGILGFFVLLAFLGTVLLLLSFLLFGLLILALLFGPFVVKLLVFSNSSLSFFPPVSLLLLNEFLASQASISNESLDLRSLLSLWGSWILL